MPREQLYQKTVLFVKSNNKFYLTHAGVTIFQYAKVKLGFGLHNPGNF